VRRTLRSLHAQTCRERLELVLVVQDADVVRTSSEPELEGFAALRVVPVGPIRNVDRAVATGVMHATAPVVALIEDHAFPASDWAEHVIAAHDTPADAVGPAILNGNPSALFSWTNYLLSYGAWSEGATPGPTSSVPGHNSSFRTESLRSFGDRLGDLLQRDGGLMEALQERGATFLREPRARVAHLNPSTWRATSAVRFQAGRSWGAARATREGWSPGRRIAFTCAGPLIPLVRLRRELGTLSASRNGAGSMARTVTALAIGLTIDALGQMVGYAAGPGNARVWLETFEMDRLRHLVPADHGLLLDRDA
jgi:hypothetical protein